MWLISAVTMRSRRPHSVVIAHCDTLHNCRGSALPLGQSVRSHRHRLIRGRSGWLVAAGAVAGPAGWLSTQASLAATTASGGLSFACFYLYWFFPHRSAATSVNFINFLLHWGITAVP